MSRFYLEQPDGSRERVRIMELGEAGFHLRDVTTQMAPGNPRAFIVQGTAWLAQPFTVTIRARGQDPGSAHREARRIYRLAKTAVYLIREDVDVANHYRYRALPGDGASATGRIIRNVAPREAHLEATILPRFPAWTREPAATWGEYEADTFRAPTPTFEDEPYTLEWNGEALTYEGDPLTFVPD